MSETVNLDAVKKTAEAPQINIRGILLRLLVFFVVLTALNVLIFSVMAFENQADLIVEVAIQTCQANGLNIKKQIEDLINLHSGIESPKDLILKVVLEKLTFPNPEGLGVHRFRLFDETGLLLLDFDVHLIEDEGQEFAELLIYTGLTEDTIRELYPRYMNRPVRIVYHPLDASMAIARSTPQEFKKIRESILGKELSNKLYKNDEVDVNFTSINLYIPVPYGTDSYLIIKPTIPVPKASQYLRFFFMIVVIAGAIMLVFHLMFALISYVILVKPMKKANDALQSQNDLLERRYKEMEEELAIAEELQKAIIPKKDDIQIPNVKIGQVYIPLEAVSGDYLDLIQIDEDHLGLLVVDVSGHGIPSALVTTMAKVSFNAKSMPGRNTADICSDVNIDLCSAIGDSDYYCTAFYAIIDLKTYDMQFTCAGHPKAVIWRGSKNEMETIKTRGFVIGSADIARYQCLESKLESGDRLLIFSDGIIEAMNPEDEIYDYERLEDYIDKNHHLDTEEFTHGLIADVQRFTGTAPQSDDISLVVFDIE